MVEARPKSTVTNLVGRVALTNDIPPEQEWPAELVHTNTPLIFADGEDTNVTSIALRAQPENYTSLSFLSPVSYYLPNRFSLLELGHDYQIAAAQWFQVGRYLYAQNPENIVFVGGGQHRSLQDYLDACSPQTMADLLSCYIPTNGGGRIHGDLTIDGRLTAGELITITNSDIHAKGFQVVNKVLTADGLMASNGMVRLNCARFVIGFGTPRIHLETNDLSAITYGGTWENPAGSVFSWQDSKIQNYLAGNMGQPDIELRNPYMRYMDVKDCFMGWKLKGHTVNNGPLKHFNLDNYRMYHFTDADVGNFGSGSAYAEVSVLVHLHRVKDEPLAIARLLENQGRRVVGALHSAFDLKFVAVTCRQQGYGNHHQDDLLHCICVVNIAILKNRAKLHLFSHPAKSRHEKWTSIPPSG